jgi:ferrous iron transport protein B
VVDGVLAGVGSVLVFLPQILVLFALIIALEDSGYMARAAFLVDRLMRACGLSGHSFIPMLSSFACAVPGIMATRVIRDRRDRLATICAAPFMTCSARLPVYALLIAAFVPARPVLGPVLDLRGVTLLGLYLLGAAAGVLAALSLKRSVLRGPTPPLLLEMPPYRWPTPRALALRLWERGREFVVRAGTVIFAASLVVWALATFPRAEQLRASFAAQRAAAEAGLAAEDREIWLAELAADERAAMLEQSLLGRAGHLLEPVFRPLGWDWRLSAAVVASFPAREVVIAAMGTIFAVGSSDVEAGLAERLVAARDAAGRPLLGVPEALGLLVFFALCLQCVSTLAVMRRETGGWAWPVAAWLAMTAVAWLGAWLTVTAAHWWLGTI